MNNNKIILKIFGDKIYVWQLTDLKIKVKWEIFVLKLVLNKVILIKMILKLEIKIGSMEQNRL